MREDAEDENDPTWRRLAWVTELEREKRWPWLSWKNMLLGMMKNYPLFSMTASLSDEREIVL